MISVPIMMSADYNDRQMVRALILLDKNTITAVCDNNRDSIVNAERCRPNEQCKIKKRNERESK